MTHFDRRSCRPVIHLAGFTGNNRLPPAIAVRDHRGIDQDRRLFAPTQTTEHANLQVLYVNGGTRTCDLRRDRTASRMPANVLVTVKASNIGTPNAAHIYKGGYGVAGPVVVPFGKTYKAKFRMTSTMPIAGAIKKDPSACGELLRGSLVSPGRTLNRQGRERRDGSSGLSGRGGRGNSGTSPPRLRHSSDRC